MGPYRIPPWCFSILGGAHRSDTCLRDPEARDWNLEAAPTLPGGGEEDLLRARSFDSECGSVFKVKITFT